MEVPVKERLTGALILIALLVIVVPEMLSGPDHATPAAQPAEAGPPIRTYSLQLDTAAARSQDQSTLAPKPAAAIADQPAPPAEHTDSAPAPDVAAAAATEQKPSTTEAKPAAEQKSSGAEQKPLAAEQKPVPATVFAAKPAAASAKDSSAAKTGQWWAQLGSFASRDNAERLTKELRAAGYSVNLARVQAGGKDLYRVRAGPAPSREAAQSLQSRLAAAGHKSSLVAP